MSKITEEPDFATGVEYWTKTPATVNGVLGGYGPTTPVPRLDALSSRQLLISLFPFLSKISQSHKTSTPETVKYDRPTRALDCGAGIGRVTSTVLLPLFDRVDLVEPVSSFVAEAKRAAAEAKKDGWALLSDPDQQQDEETKAVRVFLAGLQFFDPSAPLVPVNGGESSLFFQSHASDTLFPDPTNALDPELEGYDLVMIQWCIGHLSDEQLVRFLQRARNALRVEKGEIVGRIMLKENICGDDMSEGAGILFDVEDSSVTRSDKVFRRVFKEAELTVERHEIQRGFPKELFPVYSYVLV